MPTATPVTNIWRYQINLSRAGQRAMIGIILRNVGTPANTDYFNFCNSILVGQETSPGIWPATRDLLVSEWSMDSHQLQAISPDRYVALVRQPGGAPTPGTLAGVALPINTQVAVNRQSAVARRWGISILKPPFGSASSTSDKASWNLSFTTAVLAWGNKSVSNFVGATPADVLQPVIWSSGAVAAALEFRNVVVEPTLRVIRRRTVGVGQ